MSVSRLVATRIRFSNFAQNAPIKNADLIARPPQSYQSLRSRGSVLACSNSLPRAQPIETAA
jgi:hypothetical protein